MKWSYEEEVLLVNLFSIHVIIHYRRMSKQSQSCPHIYLIMQKMPDIL